MSLRIAFDLDGVFADMHEALVRQAEIVFGEAMARRLSESGVAETPPHGTEAGVQPGLKTRPTTEAVQPGLKTRPTAARAEETEVSSEVSQAGFQMTARQQRRLWNHIESVENFWETLREIEAGSIAKLAGLAAERRWEIIFLTKRPPSAGATSQVQSQRWLQAKGFRLPSVYVVQGSRGRIAAALALDFVIDDTPENCLDVVVDSRARAVLIWRDAEKNLPAAAKRLGIGVVKSVGECLDILAQVDAPHAERPGMIDRVMKLLGLKESTVDSR